MTKVNIVLLIGLSWRILIYNFCLWMTSCVDLFNVSIKLSNDIMSARTLLQTDDRCMISCGHLDDVCSTRRHVQHFECT